MKNSLLIFSLVAILSCQDAGEGEEKNTEDTLQGDSNIAPFPAFSKFPSQQFGEIMLLDTDEHLSEIIRNMEMLEVSNDETAHFIFPSDSTEIILPKTPILTEFKVFLKSTDYLKRAPELATFFESQAVKFDSNETLSIFHFELPEGTFRLSYFKQPDFIRLHFLMITVHA